MKNLKLLIATILAATSMIACSKDKGGGNAATSCQSGYVQVSEQQLMQMGAPQNAYYALQTNVNTQYTQTQQYPYNNAVYGQNFCVQSQYYNNNGQNYAGGNSQFCAQYPQDPSCYNNGGYNGGYNPGYNNPYGGYNGGGYYNPCAYNPYACGGYYGGNAGISFYFGW